MTHHVAAGLDGSPESLAAAEWAAEEALLRRASLRLVHAEEIAAGSAAPLVRPDVVRDWADGILTEAAEELRRRHPGLEISTRRLTGRPAAALAVDALDADLLVLGSRGLGTVLGFLVGSVGMAAVGATERPVVLVRAADARAGGPGRDRSGPYGEVLLGVDIHQSCDRLLAFAFDEAAHRGCTLRVVHAWTLPPVFSYAPVLDPGVQLEVGRTVAQSLSDMLTPWRLKYPSVHIVERAVIGPPARELVYAADNADLVIVGRRVRRSPLGAHIGHVAHAVIHHCGAPVAVVAHE
ncbi:universal stress protein [Streptomyces sp. MUM 178J]|uniref:universal stress protein n=1 Tax=Streptomyces sp. MUM 178J TaxID=2791991 RepID=UPI001F044696|nr:universal stress protein [Streptomyces sp. MUM 178J]WRQ78154.1 universal stress protein [Streptomyces sp. MUM 178J]